jgi:hypothetical protein
MADQRSSEVVTLKDLGVGIRKCRNDISGSLLRPYTNSRGSGNGGTRQTLVR